MASRQENILHIALDEACEKLAEYEGKGRHGLTLKEEFLAKAEEIGCTIESLLSGKSSTVRN